MAVLDDPSAGSYELLRLALTFTSTFAVNPAFLSGSPGDHCCPIASFRNDHTRWRCIYFRVQRWRLFMRETLLSCGAVGVYPH